MIVNQFPKKSYKKQKIKKYPPLFEFGYCWGCHSTIGLERHHLYSGNPDRSHSEQYGLYVDLCQKCHRNVTDEVDKELITKLKTEGQKRFESVHGDKKFKEVFGRNYL